jgi:hypothetical protein
MIFLLELMCFVEIIIAHKTKARQLQSLLKDSIANGLFDNITLSVQEAGE